MPDAPFPADLVPSITRFFRDVHPTLAPGRDVYPEVFHSDLFYPLQRMREAERMIQIARSVSPRTVMEIGCDKGGSLYHWCQCLPTVQRVIGCEVRGTPYAHLFRQAFKHLDFLFLPASSYAPGTVALVGDWLRRDGPLFKTTAAIDVLFIDGDKLAFDRDFAAYLPFLSPHAVVFLHDVTEKPMRDVFLDLTKRYRHDLILDVSESDEALARAKREEMITTPYEGWLRHWRGRSCGVGVLYRN